MSIFSLFPEQRTMSMTELALALQPASICTISSCTSLPDASAVPVGRISLSTPSLSTGSMPAASNAALTRSRRRLVSAAATDSAFWSASPLLSPKSGSCRALAGSSASMAASMRCSRSKPSRF